MNDIQPITLPGIDPRRPLVIAGPCSAETEEQVLDTARSLAAEGASAAPDSGSPAPNPAASKASERRASPGSSA